MNKQDPTDERTQTLLHQDHSDINGDSLQVDPSTITPMVLSLDRIKPYDRNPRRERNPRYAEIKESIRAQGGLNNPLTITRRPGDDLYMVESGGNTRLQVLTELYQETQDERFFRIHCLFRPWVGESHVLSAHLIENELRGEMVFIDKALALQDLKSLLGQETGKPLSRNAFLRRLTQKGYAVSKRHLIRFEYATQTLYPRIPLVLRAGLGPRDIDHIRKMEAAYRSYWKAHSEPQTDQAGFDNLFSEVLASHDGPDFDLEVVRQDLESRLASTLSVAIKQLRLDVDALLAGNSEESSDTEVAPAQEDAGPSVPPDPSSADGSRANGGNEDAMVGAATNQESTSDSSAGHLKHSRGVSPISTPEGLDHHVRKFPENESVADSSSADPTDLHTLRTRNYHLALGLAIRHRLEECLLSQPELGMGYTVDLPTESLDSANASGLFRQWIWWLLLSFSEQAVQPERLKRIGRDNRLGTLILEGRVEEIFAMVGEPDWKALGFQLLSDSTFEEQDFQDLMHLAQSCRQVRRLANDPGGLILWTEESAS